MGLTEKTNKEISDIELDLIENVLTKVMDPEIEIDIVNLGLIYELVYDGEKNVVIKMTFSTPNCPLGDVIVKNVQESIKQKYSNFEVEVSIVFVPRWHAGMISEKGKKLLNI